MFHGEGQSELYSAAAAAAAAVAVACLELFCCNAGTTVTVLQDVIGNCTAELIGPP